MNNKIKAARPLAVVLALSIAQLYVQASLLGPGPIAPSTATPHNAAPSLGRLIATPGKATLVNGNYAQTGDAIASGAQITSEATAAVDLGILGRVDLGPNSAITLDFTPTTVDVRVAGGCAILTSSTVAGTITSSEGAIQRTDASHQVVNLCAGASSLVNNTPNGEVVSSPAAPPSGVPDGAPSGTGNGQGGGGSVSAKAVIITTIIVAGVAIPLIVHEANNNRGVVNSPGAP